MIYIPTHTQQIRSYFSKIIQAGRRNHISGSRDMQNQGFTNLMNRRKELSDRNKRISFYLQKWGGGE